MYTTNIIQSVLIRAPLFSFFIKGVFIEILSLKVTIFAENVTSEISMAFKKLGREERQKEREGFEHWSL